MAQGKVYPTTQAALSDLSEGAVILVSGFAGRGVPAGLLRGLLDGGVGGLTCIYSASPQPNDRDTAAGIIQLVANGQVRKLISPLPFAPGQGGVIEERWQAGVLEIETVPAGTLAERLRAGGAGIGGVFLPAGSGDRFAGDKERRTFGNGDAALEMPIRADYALIRVLAADTLGSVIYEGTGRNWGPVMAMAARITIAEADRIVEPGGLDPEAIITPGIFVNRIVAA